MSIQQVQKLTEPLPPSLSSQVVSYAESVDRAAPEILRDAGVQYSKELASKLVFIAGVKKLHWLAESSYWTLENSGKLLSNMDVLRIKVGGQDMSRGGEIHQGLYNLLSDLNQALAEQQIQQYMHMPLKDIAKELARNGRG